MDQLPRHGGDIYGDPPIKLDFSVNINPLGIPTEIRRALKQNIHRLMCYPDPESRGVRGQLGAVLGVSPDMLLCGNGASELISLAVQAVSPHTALVPAPTFSGYQHALAAIGVRADHALLLEAEQFELRDSFLDIMERKRPDMIFLCRPNNPVGNCIPKKRMVQILERCEAWGSYLLADECFLGFTEQWREKSLMPLLKDYPHLLILNALTKTYALPGLRMGFLICGDADLRNRMKALQPEWSVSVPAQIAGLTQVSPAYMRKTRELLRRERKFLTGALQALGFRVYPGEANYLFFTEEQERGEGDPLRYDEALRKQGILIRNCSNFYGLRPGFYRIAVRKRRENRILVEALKGVKGHVHGTPSPVGY